MCIVNRLIMIALIGTITTINALGQNVNVQYNTNINTGINNPYQQYQVYNPYNAYNNPYVAPNGFYNVNVSNDPITSLVRVLLRNKRIKDRNKRKRNKRRNRNCR